VLGEQSLFAFVHPHTVRGAQLRVTRRGTDALRACKLLIDSTGSSLLRGSLGNYPYVDRNLTQVTGMSVFRTLAERLGLCVHARDRTRSSFGYSSLRPLKDRFPANAATNRRVMGSPAGPASTGEK
jgi:hypothetical protein